MVIILVHCTFGYVGGFLCPVRLIHYTHSSRVGIGPKSGVICPSVRKFDEIGIQRGHQQKSWVSAGSNPKPQLLRQTLGNVEFVFVP